ncbi:MAG: HAD-IA family hydrolase [Nitrososphaerota archaeon]|nr:HAD-IA family hydrolase [Nitrososphaerota archaeon]MDG6937844.1 HAD-IA family hydrolase [Nitrososphaerota archaeon]MDG6952842.1 HAD-IA family hydrolase [Nitrososphaerota archaeon]MDG6955984.1 HAD-IA family hydrolase [Nitrososphaerota archaeon]MDG6957231.1 HAD-IA family hydrolase [Nitrososphaerota archaeon]
MKKRAVFFDLGGTLLVMRRDRIISRILTGSGYSATADEVRSAYFAVEPGWLLAYGHRRFTPEESEESYRQLDALVFRHLFPGSSDAEAERLSHLMRKMWPEVQESIPLELYPDAEPTLRRLSDAGFKLALVSNAPPDVAGTVSDLGLEKYFPVVVVSGVVGVSKPNPDIFRIALHGTGAEPGEAVHIGDLYDADVKGARNAGVTGILLDRYGSYGDMGCPKISGLEGIYDFLE